MSDVVTEKRSTATASTRETKPAVVAAISSGEGQSTREEAIRERAYAIWEGEGRPDGKDLDHWLRAETEIISNTEQQASPSPTAKD